VIAKLATRRPFLDAALTERETLQHPRAGTILFDEGDQPRGVYILHSGTVDPLFRARAGDLKRMRAGAPGEILGLSAVVSGRPYEYTARIRTPCEVGFVERGAFLGLLDESPAMRFNVLRLLSRDVNASYDSLRTVAVAR
jgi:CRP-like cAMP-binding protein